MIVYTNVCDHCGVQAEIKKDDNQFEFQFSTKLLHLFAGTTPRFLAKNDHIVTFCDKECFIEYFKFHMNIDGTIKEDNEQT